MRLNERPLRLLFRPLDDVPPRRLLEDWVQDFAWQTGATVYVAAEARFSHHFRDFAAARWQRFAPRNPVAPMPRYVRNPVTGLLVPEDLAANPLPVPQQGTGPAPGVLPRELVVRQTGRVLVLPGTDGDMPPAGLRQDQIPDGEVVVVAHSNGGQAVLGLLRRDGRPRASRSLSRPRGWPRSCAPPAATLAAPA